MKYLGINDIDSYKQSFTLSNYVWDIVLKWEWLARKTLGAQYTESIDSISALIAEGFGRYFKKDKVNFYRMARGSVLEAIDWTEKAKIRKLLNQKEYDYISGELQNLPRAINQLISFTNSKLKI